MKISGEECSKCRDSNISLCENCGQYVTVPYSKHTRIKPIYTAVNRGECRVCLNIEPVNSDGHCHSCYKAQPAKASTYTLCQHCYRTTPNVCKGCGSEVDFILVGNQCVNCEIGRHWIQAFPESVRTQSCISCGRYAYLNSERECKSCFVRNHVKANKVLDKLYQQCSMCDDYVVRPETTCKSCKSKLRQCPDCGLNFSPHVIDQWQCDTCLPRCMSCNVKFITNDRLAKYCEECDTKVKQGVCTQCEEKKRLSVVGKCTECLSIDNALFNTYDDGELLCLHCHIEEVTTERSVCNTCKGKRWKCPKCQTFSSQFHEVICQKCQKT